MFSKSSLFLTLAGGLSVAALPSRRAINEPCGQISSQYEKYQKENSTVSFKVDGELAYQCLQSMPLDSDRATAFVGELNKYLQWHSTIDYLKNPPAGYYSPPTDLFLGLDDLRTSIDKNHFDNQFEFDDAIVSLIGSANDGHLFIQPCSQNIFVFQAEETLVSVSTDGLQLPQIYTAGDARLLQTNSTRLNSTKVSPVVAINGFEVTAYLHELGLKSSFQDLDAQYNNLMQRFTSHSGGNPGGFSVNTIGGWPGSAERSLEFANGTKTQVGTVAQLGQLYTDFNAKDGKGLWEEACLPMQADSESTETQTQAAMNTTLPPLTHFPKPTIREEHNLLSGYLNEPDLKDVAVLFIPSFDTQQTGPDVPLKFANHATNFVKKAVDAGKEKLIIDLSSNGGGSVTSGLDLFKLFFPNEDIFTAARMRSHEGLQLIGKVLADFDPEDIQYQALAASGIGAFVNSEQNETISWKDYLGPEEEMGASMTQVSANFNLSLVSTSKTPIRGYGPLKLNATESPFKAEDILIVTDGYCTSTCTLFVELMRHLGNVKTLAFGGRPQYGPMQTIGGSKGCQVGDLSMLNVVYQLALSAATASLETSSPLLSTKELARLNATAPRTDILQLDTFKFNLKNSYLDGDETVPVQFKYEAADCRLFYTVENVFRPASAWAAAARAVWGGGSCVAGSRRV